MPLASMLRPAAADGAPACTEAILPPRTTMDPRSITAALGPMMRTLVMVRSCAASGAVAPTIRQASLVYRYGFIFACFLRRQMARQHPGYTKAAGRRAALCAELVESAQRPARDAGRRLRCALGCEEWSKLQLATWASAQVW